MSTYLFLLDKLDRWSQFSEQKLDQQICTPNYFLMKLHIGLNYIRAKSALPTYFDLKTRIFCTKQWNFNIKASIFEGCFELNSI